MIRRFCQDSAQRMRRCGLVAVAGAVVIVAVCVLAGGVIGGVVPSGLPGAVTALLGALIGVLVGVTAAWVMLGAVLGNRARRTPPVFDEPREVGPTADEPAISARGRSGR